MIAQEQSLSGLRSVLPGSLKEIVKTTLDAPIFGPLRKWYAGLGSVLVYHRITEFKDYEQAWNDPRYFNPHLGLSVHTERFERQLRYIKEHCQPIALEDFGSVLTGRRTSKPYVLVTFDDGYLDNLELALPIAEKVGVPIAVFVTTGFISRESSPWWIELETLIANSSEIEFEGKSYPLNSIAEKRKLFITLEHRFRRLSAEDQRELIETLGGKFGAPELDRLFMNWEQLRSFSDHPLVTIGAHTVSHAVLSQESRSAARNELHDSRAELSERLEKPITTFAYPFGDVQAVGERENELAEDAAFDVSFTTRAGHIFNEHQRTPQMIPRITIDYFDDEKRFQRKLSGVESICTEPFSRIVTY